MNEGKNPNNVALDIVGRIGASGRREGGIIGLTQSQMDSVANYRGLLERGSSAALDRLLRDKRFDSAVEGDDVIPADKIDRMVTAYTNNMLRYRGETIGRTEAMGALHTAQQQGIEQAVAAGVLKAKQVKFRWNTSQDDRVRDSHAEIEGQVRALGEEFDNGLLYPGDPSGPPEEIINCRCWRTPEIDYLEGVT
jgi:hypothetical protein